MRYMRKWMTLEEGQKPFFCSGVPASGSELDSLKETSHQLSVFSSYLSDHSEHKDGHVRRSGHPTLPPSRWPVEDRGGLQWIFVGRKPMERRLLPLPHRSQTKLPPHWTCRCIRVLQRKGHFCISVDWICSQSNAICLVPPGFH
ncbi:stress-associated endoplasmic reticulum protein 2 isoform X1 [Dipodomys spectabilis]|uniref:stress-associated endoplasmic reticulum protein 2 isoform X1 n=1 Tax=Dipodomys spectabilis TaxID=105255 RepID=UPI001C534D00|nr:stress-associated endoplasmic reticulum protein 2 isoform X1 [Dipodomys spectabilis]